MPQPLLVISNERFADHHPGQRDVDDSAVEFESPRRLHVALETARFYEQVTGKKIRYLEAPPAEPEILRLVHSEEYLRRLEDRLALAQRENNQHLHIGEEAYVSCESRDAIFTAAGSGIRAVQEIHLSTACRILCLVRPPGHHAEPEKAMGFCILSNAAIAARYASEVHQKRVVIFDFDAHQGNGTEHAVREQEGILFGDIFLSGEGEYPYVDRHPAPPPAQNILKIALPFGTEGERYLHEFRSLFLPRARSFNPDLVVISAGFDSLWADPLGGFQLAPKHLFEITNELVSLAPSTISLLEGGYDLDHLPYGLLAHFFALGGD